jgi:hypothetical protein
LSIKKAKANHYYDDENYHTLHYETQIEQVKVIDDNGKVKGHLGQELDKIEQEIKSVNDELINTINSLDSIVNQELGDSSKLQTNSKVVVGAINELKDKTVENATKINDNKNSITQLSNKLDSHNHDAIYFKRSGGKLDGTVSVPNNTSLAGRNTSGTDLNIGKVNDSNQIILGDNTVETVIQAKNDNVKVNGYLIFHKGNMGHGSGFDSDTVDGLHGSQIARKDAENSFSNTQTIQNGKHLILKASSGSSSAGDVIWRKGDGTQLGKLTADVNGNMVVYTGTNNFHTFKSSGEFYSTRSHIIESNGSEVQLRMKGSSSDNGIGFVSSGDTFSIFDWKHSRRNVNFDRSTGVVEFSHAIKIQGRKLSIQSSAPSGAKAGDIWIDI